MTCVEFAKAYEAAGLHPLSVRPNAKRPLRRGWQEANIDAVVQDLQSNPDANLAIALTDEIFALDIDNKNGNAGSETLAALEVRHGPLPPTLTQITPNGGEHRLFRLPSGITVENSVGVAPGLDTRAAGGLVVAQPSTIDGRKYQWKGWDHEF